MVQFINKSFQSFSRNSKVYPKDYIKHILKSAQANTYVETISNKADSLHRRIALGYEEDIADSFLILTKKLVKLRRINNVRLAIDITDEDFYGKTSNLYLHNYTGEKGVKSKFKFIVLSLVSHPRIPILSLPYYAGQDKADLIDILIKIAKKFFKNIQVILFDRGFYSGKIFEVIHKHKINYLMFVPKNKAIEKYWKQGLDKVKHSIKYYSKKTTCFVDINLILIEHGELEWSFASNLNLIHTLSYIFLYKKRWQIETNFRVQDEARIKSRSVNYMVRYFYFMISLLLHLIWCLFGYKQFKLFIIQMYEFLLFEDLGIPYIYSN